ncbi:MAG: hypothetical protein C0483_17720 [Pirellula sp.]|nr:hypothetical protein [Pirellula sp.]
MKSSFLGRLVGVVLGVLLCCGRAPVGAAEPSAAADKTTTGVLLQHCLVTAIDDIQVPALRTGRLVKLQAKEGSRVVAGDLLAQIDDEESNLQLQAASSEKAAAHKKADSPLEERFAKATLDVSVAEHEAAVEANRKFANSVSDIEVLKLELATKQAALRVDLSRFNREVLEVELGTTDAKASLAAADVRLRRVEAPLAGEVAEIFARPGEWVESGAPVVRVVRVDRLRVDGFIKVRDMLPGDVFGKPVKVVVELADAKRFVFDGVVTFVSPLIDAGSQYRIWAEVENRQEHGQWLLRPGMQAEMTIVR